MRVKELMSQPVRFCEVTDTADKAAQIMWEADCGVVPVVDGDRHVVGMITDRDICMTALFHGTALQDIPISEVMSSEVYACGPDDELSEAERLMSARQVHRLPVLATDGTPIGMLSVADLVREARPGTAKHAAGDSTEECVRTIAAISQPRAVLQATGRRTH